MSKQYARQWQVPSASRPGKTYIVSLSHSGEWSCACKAWTTRVPRRACAHIKEAKETGDRYLLWSSAAQEMPKRHQQRTIHFTPKRAITFDD